MRFRNKAYQMWESIADHLPSLRPAQQRGLAAWVFGTVEAGSSCESSVIRALVAEGGRWDAWKAQLREFLADGKDKAAPCTTQVDVSAVFPDLLRWVVEWWQDDVMALAIDPTLDGDKLAALVISVVYRGCAIPVAWHILPANQEEPWMPHLVRLLETLQPAMPRSWPVVVLTDRGLWSPALWDAIRRHGWHPLCRVRTDATFQPQGGRRQPVRALVPSPGQAWVGKGMAYKHAPVRRPATLIVIWAQGQKDPWVLLTDLPPRKVGVSWYALRFWIELGFRVLKSLGWNWEQTRRRKPERVMRHWIVLAVATLWVVATGTRVEDAEAHGRRPEHTTLPLPPVVERRRVSVFARGLVWLQRQLHRERLWRTLWLMPEPWPEPPENLSITYHADSEAA